MTAQWSVDVEARAFTESVPPTADWFAPRLPVLAAYHRALIAILELDDRRLAARVR